MPCSAGINKLGNVKAELEPSHVAGARTIARGWIVLGSLAFALAAAFGVAHYGFGVPMHEAHASRDATTDEIATTLGALLGGGAFFALAGAALLRWLPRR
jgi:hypothetical protein